MLWRSCSDGNDRTQFILETAALTHDIGIKNGEAKFGAGKCSSKT